MSGCPGDAAAPAGSARAGDRHPLVSVLLLNYNQAGYLPGAIDSVLAQDYPNFELIIADDGSTDGSAAIIRRYADEWPAIVVPVLNPRNGGITANCNSGLARARGKYFTHFAADDLLLPGKLSAQVAWLEADADRVLCGHQVEVFYDDGRPSHPLSATLPSGRGPDHVLRHGIYGTMSIMVRRDAIPPHGFEPSLPKVSDPMLWAEVLAGGGRYGAIDRTLGRYRRHGSNISGNLLATLDDVTRYYRLFAARYPRYRRSCAYGYVRHVLYDAAVFLLASGRPRAAIAPLLRAIVREPGFVKAWIRLAQAVAGAVAAPLRRTGRIPPPPPAVPAGDAETLVRRGHAHD